MLADFYRGLLFLHVAVAAISLAAFWAALFLEKGSARHRRVGRVYARAMYATGGSGGLLAALLAAVPLAVRPPDPGLAPDELREYAAVARGIGSVLVLVGLLLFGLTHFGVRAVERRYARSLRARLPDVAVAGLLALAGLVAIPVALVPGFGHLDGLGVFVALTGAVQLRYVLRLRGGSWIAEHLAGVFGAATVAHGALATNVASYLVPGLETPESFAAAGPVAVAGVAATIAACAHYRRRYGPRRDPAAPASRCMLAS